MNSLLKPKSVAVIGVSRDPQKIGYLVFDNLISAFRGKVFGVNPNADMVLGEKIYPTVLDIKSPIEMAVICVPAPIVLKVLESCGRKGVKAAVIITSGFSEVGAKGKDLQAELEKTAKKFNIRLLGPNCLGIINNFNGLNASFATASLPAKYRVGIFSQSGAMGAAILDYANGNNFGFSYFVSLGNKIDISEIDLIDSWIHDENVAVGVGYLEDVKDGAKFIEVAKKFTAKKPLIILKGGATKEGSAAAHLHTAAMAQDEVVFAAAMEEAGVIMAKNLNDLVELAVSFAQNRMPTGKRLAIISNAGGPSVVAVDAASTEDVEMATFSGHTTSFLSQKTEAASIANPIDLRGDAKSSDFKIALSLCEKDPGVDGILMIVTPQAMTEVEEIAWEAVRAARGGKKPIYVNFIGGELVERAIEIARENGVPTFSFPERAIRAFRYQAEFASRKPHRKITQHKNPAHHSARAIINFSGGKIRENQIGSLLRVYGIPMAKTKVVQTAEAAAKAAKEIKPPLVMKISSHDILHKTDVGGVILGIKNEEEAKKAYEEIIKNIKKNMPKAKIDGVTVMEMAKEGLELIIGAKRDPVFGPIVMFGFGGIYVELVSDFSVKIGPFDEQKIKELIGKTSVSKVLAGYRNTSRFNIHLLVSAILGLGQLVTEHPEISQVEINPIILGDQGKGILGLDAKVEIQNES